MWGSEMGQIHELLPRAMAAIGVVGKTGQNTAQRYNFRAIDSVVSAVNPVFTELGICLSCEIISCQRDQQGKMRYAYLHCRYIFTAPDGSSVSTDAFGEGFDSGDKASYKAMSGALKYALCHSLLIPTQDRSDPEWDNLVSHEEKSLKAAKVQLLRNVTAWRRQHATESSMTATEYIKSIIAHRYDATELSEAAQVEDIWIAIQAGEYDPATGKTANEHAE